MNDCIGLGKQGYCICVRCNIKVEHEHQIPCKETLCPQCGKKMLRENSYHHQQYLISKEIKKKNNND